MLKIFIYFMLLTIVCLRLHKVTMKIYSDPLNEYWLYILLQHRFQVSSHSFPPYLGTGYHLHFWTSQNVKKAWWWNPAHLWSQMEKQRMPFFCLSHQLSAISESNRSLKYKELINRKTLSLQMWGEGEEREQFISLHASQNLASREIHKPINQWE